MSEKGFPRGNFVVEKGVRISNVTSPSPARERDAKVSEAVVEPALWGVVLCAADSSVLACCYCRAMCVWPALGSGGETCVMSSVVACGGFQIAPQLGRRTQQRCWSPLLFSPVARKRG